MRFTQPYLFALLGSAGAIILPEPAGPYHVAHGVFPLTDNDRTDPYAPANASHPRKVVTSVFWPLEETITCANDSAPYMPPATAMVHGILAESVGLSNDTFSEFSFNFCRPTGRTGCSAKSKQHALPLALFSPGGGNSRLIYSALAKSVASYGYVVVTVDHPYDANIVEFPDETVILSADIPEDDESLEALAKVRADDLSFVLSQLADPQSEITKGFHGRIDFKKVVAFGHSLGGASSAGAMLTDTRVLGGVDLDGRFFEPALSKGLDRPFFLLGRPNHREEDTTWKKFWSNLRGAKVEAEAAGATHGTFTDFPLLIQTLDLPSEYQPAIEAQFGSVKGVGLVSRTVANFFEFVLEGNGKPLNEQAANSTELKFVGKKLSSQ